ncbi:MAG: DUF2220 family protein [Dysgonamonadaceae bacterium]|jgi:hypothetical protein|nr:DUF2220 family protein [Dysgonamonadaceae bacterium]
MITASEIKKKSENIYIEYLKSIVCGETFFPKALRSNKSVSSNFNEMRKELAEIIEYSKDRKGFGYSITYRQINTRQHGTQSLPEEISFQTETDFLKYLHKEKEVSNFRNNIHTILSQYSELKEWLTKYPQKIIDNQNQWDDILKVCNYFKINPQPNLYIRELPINVHTKFIENNKAIIKELLDILIADSVKANETIFEKRFNLKYAESLVRFKILDNNISQKYFSGLNDLSIPISQFEKLNLPVQKALIVENKTNLLTIALTLPDMDGTIVVFGSGYKVENLKNVLWFNGIKLFYWGDLDVQGFEILSQFRGYFPHTQSILMDKSTFDRFFEKDSGIQTKNTAKLNLTNEEQELYDLLKTNNWRLEQEKISVTQVDKTIKNTVK